MAFPHRLHRNTAAVSATTLNAAGFCQSMLASIAARTLGAIPGNHPARTPTRPNLGCSTALLTVDPGLRHAWLAPMHPRRSHSLNLPGWIPCFRTIRMACLAATIGAVFSGCSGSSGSRLVMPAPEFPAIIRPLDGSVGTVVQVHERLRFVVLDYSFSTLPPAGSFLEVYRSTNRVGRVRLSRWNHPTTAAADFVEGAPQVGDIVRPD